MNKRSIVILFSFSILVAAQGCYVFCMLRPEKQEFVFCFTEEDSEYKEEEETNIFQWEGNNNSSDQEEI